MGNKRLYEEVDFQGLPLKHPRHLDFSNMPTQFEESLSDISSPKMPDPEVVHGNWNGKQTCREASENALVPSKCTDEDLSFRLAACSSLFPEFYEYKSSLPGYSPINNVDIPYLDCFPKKQVALGPDHQASIPSLMSSSGDSNNGEKLMGTCIIPMPDIESDHLGVSGADCCCPDIGSLRCVRQHIAESRDKLRKSLGHDKFVSLGLHNMGEEVSWKWTEDEESLFRAAIYSNPVSLGQNFWKHLAQVFPSRSMKEIVSYYFNVFMLRKRATQNRSSVLEVDSDDDEFHGIDIGSHEDEDSEDDDSAIESPVEEFDQSNRGEDLVTEDDDDGETGKDPTPENYEEDNTVQDDSCTSFEFQAEKGDDPYFLMDDAEPMFHFRDDEVLYRLYSTSEKAPQPPAKDGPHEPGQTENGETVKVDEGSSGAMDLVPLFDFRDEKAWDAIFPGSL